MVLLGDSFTLNEKNRITMADIFKKSGYNTACVGKWHLGLEWQKKENPLPSDYNLDSKYYINLPRTGTEPTVYIDEIPEIEGLDIDFSKPIKYGPNQYGFDYFFGLAASLDQPPFVYIENDRVLKEPKLMSGEKNLDRRSATLQESWQIGLMAKGYNHEEVLDDMNDKVLQLIDGYSKQDNPFFIYYPTPAVHGPLLPNKKFRGSSGLNLYADIVLQLDDVVGSIIKKLKKQVSMKTQ